MASGDHDPMDDWARSWKGTDDDLELGEGLVEVLRGFVGDLRARGLGARTVRRHLDNAWLIGGEIVRQSHDNPAERAKGPRRLLWEAVEYGEAPLADGLTMDEQESVDVTARRLLRYLRGGVHSSGAE
jgi:hypothetical protein